jgi:hypothetical protein
MENKPRGSAKRIIAGIAFLVILAVFTVQPPFAASGISGPKEGSLSYKMNPVEAQYKILGVLENKMEGKKLSVQAREKIWALNERQIRLIISLCDRIEENDHAAGAEFAYLLITALILLS